MRGYVICDASPSILINVLAKNNILCRFLGQFWQMNRQGSECM